MDNKKTENASQGVPEVSDRSFYASPNAPVTSSKGVLDDEIDILKILTILWGGWRIIISCALVFVLLGSVYAFRKHDIYQASVLVVSNKRKNGSAGGMSARLSSLAALAGIGIGSEEDSEIGLNLAIMNSTPFAIDAVRRYNLMPVIFPPELRKPGEEEPSTEAAAGKLLAMVITKQNESGGLISISVKDQNPKRAFILAETVVKAINTYIKQQYMERTKQDIESAYKELAKNPPLEVAASLFAIISEKTQHMVLVGSQDDYVFRVIEPATVPQDAIYPRRGLIITAFFIGGTMAGILVSFVNHAFGKKRVS